MISAWWLVPIVLAAVAGTVAVMAVMKAESNADDLDEAFAEGARKGADKTLEERDRAKRQARAWLALAETYRSQLDKARAENAHLRVMAGLEQEGAE